MTKLELFWVKGAVGRAVVCVCQSTFPTELLRKERQGSVLASPMVKAADFTKHRRVTGGYGPPTGPTGRVWSTPVGRSRPDLPKATQLEQESRPVSLPSPGFQHDTRQGEQDALPVWLTRQPHPKSRNWKVHCLLASRRKGGFIQVPCSLLVSPDLLPPG